MSITTQRGMVGRSIDADTVHELVRRHAVTRPDALAVVHGAQHTSYWELDDLAAVYAAQLAALGLRRGDFLPVALPRGLRLVATVLGALRLGAAYALLDLAWPAERIKDVTGQLGADLLVTDTALPSVPVRTWSPPAQADPSAPRLLPVADVRPEDPCSVFFTSGSTGRPKGAVSPHRGTARLTGMETFGPDTVMPLACAQPWDMFSLEMWAPLMAGGTIVVSDEPYLSGPLIRDFRARHQLNTVWLTTSLFNMLVDEDVACFEGLGTVMAGGERLSPPHVRSFIAAHPEITLVNGFGPVETTVFCSTHRIRPADCDVDGGIPIGVPMPRTRIYVLDGERVCEVGEVGELCVAGDGLAVGYLGNDELTSLKFPAVRLLDRTERVYRTGDLGLRDTSGILHYRGRADRQLKIHGYRVEPGEVESAAGGLPGVGRCVVLARRGPGGQYTGMDAAVTAAGPDPVDTSAVLGELRTLLPAFSIPDRLVEVTAIPLTRNGKMDEAALRDLIDQAAPPPPATPGHQHADPAERAVAEVFGSVLGVPATRLDPRSTLVELGGTSLDAGRVSARLAEVLGRPVPPSQVFRTPTIRALAAAVTGPTAGLPAEAGPPAAVDFGLGGAAALSSMQRHMLVQNLVDPDDLTQHCVYGWRIEGRPNRPALRSALAYLHERHQYLGSVYILGQTAMARPGQAPVPGLSEFLVQTESEARTLLDRELGRPFQLQEGQVWRAVLAAVREVHVTLLGVAVHHIAFDGTSAAILADDLSRAYRAYLAGAIPDQPRAASLAEVAAAREAQARYADLPRQREYWRATMPGIAALDFPGGAESPSWRHSREVTSSLPSELCARVRVLAVRRAVSPFVVYLSAYQQALAALTGQRHFGIGIPVSQRSAQVLSDAVSLLINVVCLRLRTEPDSEPAAAIAQTARDVAAAFAAQDTPFDEVADIAGIRPVGHRLALCQNFFALQDHRPPILDLGHLRSSFFLPIHPDIPNEVFTEVWPQLDGSAQVVISYRPHEVSGGFCRELAAGYQARLERFTAP